MNLTIFSNLRNEERCVVRWFWQYLSKLLLCFNLAVLLKSINYRRRNKFSWWAGSINVLRSSCEREFWHKRLYHMYSDVIFGWVVCIWLTISHFVQCILILFSPSVSNLPGVVGGTARSPPGPRGSASGSVRRYSAKSTLLS